ncbi:MotA/TolQ/ExbB proton channel family protein [Desulfogranum marinum]|jgi:biopolymer transport protein ExbB/TolQ|uniref:MotA/TolQ/ExbB proton channel family protein n=1 Tax=Desulfogranum marinum TaxID=453220 RepID=UPI0029C7CC2F|nr:MotA/TolQ/ExbB proton channel family protein [Desulfogranum marinum]
MPKKIPFEFFYQIFSLLTAFILVHGAFVTVIRPEAELFQIKEQQQLAVDPDYVQQRNFYVVLKDYEQEACLVLMLWAMAILGFKGVSTWQQRRQLDVDLLQLPETLPLGPEDATAVKHRIQELSGKKETYLLSRALDAAIRRFGATHNVQDAATALRDVCTSEGERLEAELSTIRYIAWAIPSVGFIGTVRGIGAALSLANKAVEGDITGVTQNLGVAFNSTFIALVISIVLMFFIHQLQLLQDRLVLDTESYCDRNLIARLRAHPFRP